MAKTRSEKEVYFEDEIDLTPYINRVVKRKWWILGAVVLAAAAAYVASYMLPKQYKINATLTFSGEEISVVNDQSFTQEETISSSYVSSMVDEFSAQLRANNQAEGLVNITVTGKEYPLTVEITVGEGVAKNLYHNQLLTYLNSNSYISTQVEAEMASFQTTVDDYSHSIESIDNEISRIERTLDKGGDVDSDIVSTYAILISTRKDLQRQKQELEAALERLQGFTYVVKPYFLNNGNSVSPNKLQNAAIAGFSAAVLVGGVAAFKGESKGKGKKKKKS